MKTLAASLIVLTAFFPGRVARGQETTPQGENPWGGRGNDVHLHLWGVAGRPRQGADRSKEFEAAAQNLLEQMDRHGVAKAVLLPPPRAKEGDARAEFSLLLEVARRHPGRFVVGGGGDTLNPMIHQTPAGAVTEEILARFEREARRLAELGVKAFGEMTALHLSLNPTHPFEEVSPDHPLFLRLAELSAEYGIPIDLHMEAVPEEMAKPPGLNDNNPDRLAANIAGLERLLEHDRKARIVWQHIGWDNTGGMTIDLLKRLLAEHSNLCLALRVEERLVTIGGMEPMPHRIVDREWKIDPAWRALFEEFPDRFVIGSDEFFGGPGSRRAPQSFEETWRILDQLPADLAAKIGRENAARIYGLE
ncbi:MAG: amidohydrolase family protein [Planctomycetes bacterium]|nr:amidohydrolase family protein [Planctomycetota bacterium]